MRIYLTKRSGAAFSLVEIIVVMAISSILLVLVFTIVANVSKTTTRALQQSRAFQQARDAFSIITERVANATLSVRWDYDDSQPAKIMRQSDLQFRSGNASDILAPETGNPLLHPCHALFFQTALGYTSKDTLSSLHGLLNGIGYFIEFGPPSAPGFIAESTLPLRYHLMQFLQPSEDLHIYDSKQGIDWIRDPLAAEKRPVQILADNIVALAFLPQLSFVDDATGTLLSPDYDYDSRMDRTYTDGGLQTGSTLHRLPPRIDIVMVAIDETSAAALQREYLKEPPDLGQQSLFVRASSSATQLQEDISTLEHTLIARKLHYLILHQNVVIRAAR